MRQEIQSAEKGADNRKQRLILKCPVNGFYEMPGTVLKCEHFFTHFIPHSHLFMRYILLLLSFMGGEKKETEIWFALV